MLNRNFKDFKFQHSRNKNQIIYTSQKVKNDQEVLNLIDNFLVEKNSFIFESVEKGKIRGRYTIFGKNPDKIWEFNNRNSYLTTNNVKKKIKGEPEKIIEKIIEEFKFKTPVGLPPICSLLSGYFSYDSIRYIEKIPNKCMDDLNLPDVRLLRPRTLIIHDNLKKKIFYIINIYNDEKISDYKRKYFEIDNEINNLLIQASRIKGNSNSNTKTNIKVKSNTSKNSFLRMVNEAKKYIKIGDIFQVVLSQRFEAKLSKTPLEIYKKVYGITSEITISGGYVYINTNGVPDHKSPYFKDTKWHDEKYEAYDPTNPNVFHSGSFNLNPNRVSELSISFKIPNSPSKSSRNNPTSMGPIGVSLNGVPFYNQYAGMNQPLTREVNSFDNYNGHPCLLYTSDAADE